MKKFAFLLLGAVTLFSCQQEKTAFVNNDMLSKNYNAMEASNQKLQKQQKEMQESMQAEGEKFQKKVQVYQDNLETMSKEEEQKRRDELMKEQQQLQQKQQMQSQMLQQQNQKVQDSLKEIMDSKVSEYAEAHGYTYIFGANENDNILYAKDSKNITQDVLEELNKGEGDSAAADKDKSEKK